MDYRQIQKEPIQRINVDVHYNQVKPGSRVHVTDLPQVSLPLHDNGWSSSNGYAYLM